MTDATTKQEGRGGQGRPKGMRVVFCKDCGRRVTGFPRKRVVCKSCGTVNTIPVQKSKKSS